jgi:hypothetical protein
MSTIKLGLTNISIRLGLAGAASLGGLTVATAGVPDAAPPRAEIATPPSTPASTVSADLVLGTAVEHREVRALAEGDALFAGDMAFAWTRVVGAAGGAVTHVWIKDGREIARHGLTVGSSPWRTWTRQRVRAGTFTVRVLAADGATLAETTFEVRAAPDEGGC